MSEAIETGKVALWTTPLGKWFPRSEMMAKALETWPLHVIEEALGDEADGILPQAIRTGRRELLSCWERGPPARTYDASDQAGQIGNGWRARFSQETA
jgi:hypothetical protein